MCAALLVRAVDKRLSRVAELQVASGGGAEDKRGFIRCQVSMLSGFIRADLSYGRECGLVMGSMEERAEVC